MIRGQYLTSRDDIEDVLAVRRAIPEFLHSGRDENDTRAHYVVLYDDDGKPLGCGRMYANASGNIVIDTVGVLPSCRRMYYGDVILGMLLSRARLLSAPEISALVPDALIPYFSRYGFEPMNADALFGQPAHYMRILAQRAEPLTLGAHDEEPMCTGDCAHCKRRHQ